MKTRILSIGAALLLGACQSPLAPVDAEPPSDPVGTYSLSDVDQAPKLVGRQQHPYYPFEMRRAGISGEVIVRFVITPEGRVINATAVKATSAAFAIEAVKAVSQWHYTPALKDGVPVYCHMQVPVNFNLNIR